MFAERKIKNKNIWNDKILSVLKKNNKKMSVIEIAKELGCCHWVVRDRSKPLIESGKINREINGHTVFLWVE